MALGLSDEMLERAASRLKSSRSETARLVNIVKVCGEDFDSSEDNRTALWSFLASRVPYDALAEAQPLDLKNVADLSPISRPSMKFPGERPRASRKKPTRQAKAIDELVGLAGEIYVYRMLQLRYGRDVVTSSAWISENSRHVFPENRCDDGAGCDFSFTAGGKAFRIEVKSTTGDDESFTLGASEITLAMRLATKRGRKIGTFVLVHVRRALSDTPVAVVLPNPYEPKTSGLFSISTADARVWYRSTQTAETQSGPSEN
jgi:hypothetical protein